MVTKLFLTIALCCGLSAPVHALTAADRYLMVMMQQVPGAPTIGTATAGDSTVSVTFTAPSVTGSSPITGYTVTSNPGGIVATGTSSPIVVSGLTDGVSYHFNVTATNSSGTGPASADSNIISPYIVVVSTNLLLHFDGVNGSTTFTDSSGNYSMTPRRYSTLAYPSITTTRSVFGGSAGSFPNSYACLTTDASASTFTGGDFTVEGWFYYPTASASNVYALFYNTANTGSPTNPAMRIYIATDTYARAILMFQYGTGTGSASIGSSYFSAGAWHHFAAVKYNSVCTNYLDGVGTSHSCSGPGGGPGTTSISGSYSSAGGYCVLGLAGGNLDEIRVLNGTAVYRGDFTPPAAPFTVLP